MQCVSNLCKREEARKWYTPCLEITYLSTNSYHLFRDAPLLWSRIQKSEIANAKNNWHSRRIKRETMVNATDRLINRNFDSKNLPSLPRRLRWGGACTRPWQCQFRSSLRNYLERYSFTLLFVLLPFGCVDRCCGWSILIFQDYSDIIDIFSIGTRFYHFLPILALPWFLVQQW